MHHHFFTVRIVNFSALFHNPTFTNSTASKILPVCMQLNKDFHKVKQMLNVFNQQQTYF